MKIETKILTVSEILDKCTKTEDYHLGVGITLEDAEWAIQFNADRQTYQLKEQLAEANSQNEMIIKDFRMQLAAKEKDLHTSRKTSM